MGVAVGVVVVVVGVVVVVDGVVVVVVGVVVVVVCVVVVVVGVVVVVVGVVVVVVLALHPPQQQLCQPVPVRPQPRQQKRPRLYRHAGRHVVGSVVPPPPVPALQVPVHPQVRVRKQVPVQTPVPHLHPQLDVPQDLLVWSHCLLLVPQAMLYQAGVD